VRVLAGDLQQVAAAQALEPERGALARRGARQEQGSGSVLAETQGEESAIVQLRQNQRFHVLRRQALKQVERRLVRVGEADQDAVVVVQALRVVAETLPQSGFQGQAQGQVHPA